MVFNNITNCQIKSFNIKVDVEYYITLFQEIEEVDTDEHYTPKITIGILDVTLKQKV
jgi:hypothetical protein